MTPWDGSPSDYKTAVENAQALEITRLTGLTESHLAFYLALLQQESPDLVFLVERSDGLPDAIRAGILAMVKAAQSADQKA